MVLDAVLVSPEMRWLGTASEKVAYFTAATSLQVDQLPHLTFGVESARQLRTFPRFEAVVRDELAPRRPGRHRMTSGRGEHRGEHRPGRSVPPTAVSSAQKFASRVARSGSRKPLRMRAIAETAGSVEQSLIVAGRQRE